MARKFFYVCAGLLCLAIAFQMGVKSAGAQAGSGFVGISADTGLSHTYLALEANGQVYETTNQGTTWTYRGNAYSNAPTPTQHRTFGQVKEQYR